MAEMTLSRLPWYAQLGAFLALSLAGAGGYYYYYEMPQQAAIAKQQQELAAIRERVNTGLGTARQLPEFRKQVADLEARLDSLKPILPEQKDVGDLLRRIQGLATQSNLTIRGFRPKAVDTKEMHAEWPISLELEGSYHNLGLFLDRVSKFPRIINIGSLVLINKATPTPGATIEITCTATTFVLIDTPPAVAAAPATEKPAPAAGKKS